MLLSAFNVAGAVNTAMNKMHVLSEIHTDHFSHIVSPLSGSDTLLPHYFCL